MSIRYREHLLLVFAFGAWSVGLHAADDPPAGATQTPADVMPSIVKPGRPHGQRDPHGGLTPEIQIQIALRHRSEGRPHEAINTLNNAVMRYGENAQLYAVRGSLYLEQGRVSDALSDLETAIRLGPNDAAALINRAQAYRSFGRTDEALADLNRAVELAPDLLAAHFNRGAMWFEKGELKQALADFDYCIAVDPHAPSPYFNRAAVYDAMDKREAAVADLSRFLELTDNETWKQTARDILKAWDEQDKAARGAEDS